jgi:hypothetical protein
MAVAVAEAERLTLDQVAARFNNPRTGRGPDRRTVWRWIRVGAQGADGKRVKLNATWFNGRWLVDPKDLEQFARDQQPETATA